MRLLKEAIKKSVNFVGFDLVRTDQVPQHNLMGLRKYPIRTIVDVGANEGWFAKKITKLFPEAHIYCFEPLPTVYQELHDWAQETNGKIITYNVALGESEDVVNIQYHEDGHASSSLLNATELCHTMFPFTKKKVSIPVNQTTLDTWMASVTDDLAPDIFLKMDVQGYEDKVIKGGKQLFKKARACLLEINLVKLYQEQPSFGDIFRLFDELGYSYAGNYDQVYDHDGRVLYIDALFMKGN